MDKWDAGNQLEGLTCDLELLQDLLNILFNEMDEEREAMDLSGNPSFSKRQRPLQSLLIAAIREADNIYTACKDLSDLLYKEGSAERKTNQKQT